jgi:hypothetical protein
LNNRIATGLIAQTRNDVKPAMHRSEHHRGTAGDTHIARRLSKIDPLGSGTYRSVATGRDPSDSPVANRVRPRRTAGEALHRSAR